MTTVEEVLVHRVNWACDWKAQSEYLTNMLAVGWRIMFQTESEHGVTWTLTRTVEATESAGAIPTEREAGWKNDG